MKCSRTSATAIALFLVLWLANGVLINSSNLREFNLQQMGIEAIVERGHFYVEGSSAPELKPGDVDVFEYRGHWYAAKQPGQFLLGALVYFVLHQTGLSYVQNFLLTSALVTFWTTSLVTALAGTSVFLFARELAPPATRIVFPLAIAIGFSLATTALPYSGIAHHDAIAASLLFVAFYLLFRATHAQDSARNGPWIFAAGALIGWVVTTSMLPVFMAGVTVLYLASFRQWDKLGILAAGILAGLLPLLLYDAINFGNPLMLPNIAGDFADTFFNLDAENFQSKLVFYATFLVQYTPLVLWGLVGLVLWPKRFRREQVFILGMVAVLAGYIFNIDTVGHCQFGPRYLLPAMPFLALGLVGVVYISQPLVRGLVAGLVLLTALFSAAANILGAMFGAMYCDIQWYAVPYYWKLLTQGKFLAFPLAAWLVIPLYLALVALVWFNRPRRVPSTLSPWGGRNA
jgi:hypothetical protein